MGVFRNIKIAVRSLFRFRSDAIINVIGLSVGITISIIVLLYVRNELNYDRHLSNYKNTYRVITEGVIGDNYFRSAVTPRPLSNYLLNEFSEVTGSVRLIRGSNKLVSYKYKKFNEDNFYYADTSFFKVFNLKIITSTKDDLLSSHQDVVVSKSIARKYFENEDPLGKEIKLDNGLIFYVSGICEDFPPNSHIHCDFIASYSSISKLYKGKNIGGGYEELNKNWLQLDQYTYIIAKDTLGLTKRIAEKVDVIIHNHLLEFQNKEESSLSDGIKSVRFKLQGISDIHLQSNLENELEPNSKYIYVVLFMSIAVFVLIITSINFINLTTARASKRVQEIGVRKITGVNSKDLYIQFVTEAITYSFIALFIGLVLVELLLPGFNFLFNLDLHLNMLEGRIELLYVTGLTVMIGLISGIYPAYSFSRYNEVDIFNQGTALGKKSMLMRGFLAGGQILVATFLVILALGMYWNIKFLENIDLGFNSKNIVVVERGHALGKDFNEIKRKLSSIPGVIDVSASKFMIGEVAPLTSFKYLSKSGEKLALLPYNYVEKDFLKLLQVNFIAGEVWEESDEKMSHDIVITASTKSYLNFTKPLGMKINYASSTKWDYGFSISGVSKDFHFEPVQYPVRPLVLMQLPKGSPYENLLIRISDKVSQEKTISKISEYWDANTEGEPFEFEMLDALLSKNLDEEHTVLKIIVLFSILSLFVAWLGIRAFTTYVSELKTSDFHVKRILGASHVNIFNELFLDIGQFLMTGIIVAIPLAYFVLQLWLNGFAYYSRMPVFVMLGIGLLLFGLSFLIILTHSIRALKNLPEESELDV